MILQPMVAKCIAYLGILGAKLVPSTRIGFANTVVCYYINIINISQNPISIFS